MEKRIKNIVIVSSVVAVGVTAYFVINNFIKKPNLTNEEKELLEKMEAQNRSGGNANNSNSGSNSSSSNNTNNPSDTLLSSDAKIILYGLNGWTTDNDEKLIVTVIKRYNKETFKKLESYFNTQNKYKGNTSMLGTPLKEWLEDDLSNDNFNQIKKIIG